MLYEKMLTAVEETSTFGLEWDPPHHRFNSNVKTTYTKRTRDAPGGWRFNLLTDLLSSQGLRPPELPSCTEENCRLCRACMSSEPAPELTLSLPWCEEQRTRTAFGTRTVTAMFVDADLFHHFSLRKKSDPLPSPTAALAFFTLLWMDLRGFLCPTSSFSEALEKQRLLVANRCSCRGGDDKVTFFSKLLHFWKKLSSVFSPPRKWFSNDVEMIECN